VLRGKRGGGGESTKEGEKESLRTSGAREKQMPYLIRIFCVL